MQTHGVNGPVNKCSLMLLPFFSIVASILKCINVLRPHWCDLKYQGETEDMPEIVTTEKIPE